jgi:hypothetical protein
MLIPFKLINLDKWKVFKGNLPQGSPKQHNIILIHKTDKLSYFYITSQVDKARKYAKYDTQSLVEIQKEEWNILTEEISCVQCGKPNLIEIAIEDFKNEYENGNIQLIGDLPKEIQTKIITAICTSKTYNDTEKKIYTCNNTEA